MKPSIAVLALSTALCFCARAENLTVEFNDSGLSSIKSGELELLGIAQPRVDRVFLKTVAGEIAPADVKNPQVRFDRETHTLTQHWNWGEVACIYTIHGDRIDFDVRIDNKSDRGISAIELTLLTLKFPQKPAGFDWPQVSPNIDAPTIIRADYGPGAVALCNEDFFRRLHAGFPWAIDGEKREWPVILDTGRREGFPDFFALIDRPIFPGGRDTYRVSLRFGGKRATEADLASDLIERYRKEFPFALKWPDRRPIGMLVLSSSETHAPNSPRGWFLDKTLDVTTEEGRKVFAERLNKYGDESVRVLKAMDAQGAIIWDIEGQEFPHATSYIGDPRALPPEMAPLADAFFKKFTDANLCIGVCVRPTLPVRHPYANGVHQVDVRDIFENLNDKIQYARKRWGCTLVYVDSDIDHDAKGRVVHDALIFERLCDANPGVLLIPEHAYVLHHAYTAPYKELKQNHAGTPADALRIYPEAFSVLFIPDATDVDKRHDELVRSVKRGDILMFRGWWLEDPFNEKVKKIYEDARK